MTSKGQVTIPAEMRDKARLSPGNKVEFISCDQYILIIPLNKSVKDLKGILPKPSRALSCDEMNNIIRKEYDDRS